VSPLRGSTRRCVGGGATVGWRPRLLLCQPYGLSEVAICETCVAAMTGAQNENVVRQGVSVESARAVLKERGKLSTAELVRLRVRYFTDGVALGNREFVEGLFEAQRELFGPRRKEGARRIAEAVTPFL